MCTGADGKSAKAFRESDLHLMLRLLQVLLVVVANQLTAYCAIMVVCDCQYKLGQMHLLYINLCT